MRLVICSQVVRNPLQTAEKLASVIGKMTATAEDVVPAPVFFWALQSRSYLISSQGLILSELGSPLSRWHPRASVVETLPQAVEWQTDCFTTSTVNDNIGCLDPRLGSSLHIRPHREQVVTSTCRMDQSYQLPGTSGFLFSPSDICLGQEGLSCNVAFGQHLAYIKHKGGPTYRQSLQASGVNVEMVHEQEHNHNSFSHSGSRQWLEWMLDHGLFVELCRKLGLQPTVDLFASRINHQLTCYISWKPDPGALSVDALSMMWTNELGHAFPPFCLLAQVLRKVEVEKADLLTVTLTWTTQVWYPMLLQLAIALPTLLPQGDWMLTQPHLGLQHPLSQSLHLAAWIVSGVVNKQRVFQRCPCHA